MRDTRRKAEGGRRNEGAILALCFALLAPVVAPAQTSDPTRPPAGIDSGPAESEAGDAGGGMMLQSVMISPTGRSAIINGVVVRQGQKYGDAVLVRVSESEVVLKSGSESQVLKLYPGVEKRAAASSKGAARKGGTPQ